VSILHAETLPVADFSAHAVGLQTERMDMDMQQRMFGSAHAQTVLTSGAVLKDVVSILHAGSAQGAHSSGCGSAHAGCRSACQHMGAICIPAVEHMQDAGHMSLQAGCRPPGWHVQAIEAPTPWPQQSGCRCWCLARVPWPCQTTPTNVFRMVTSTSPNRTKIPPHAHAAWFRYSYYTAWLHSVLG
jgi:hypothetical protein